MKPNPPKPEKDADKDLETFARLPEKTKELSHLQGQAAKSRLEAQYDAVLVRRFLGGDDSAFVEIATRYRSKLTGIAHEVLQNRADAEEIAQDALIRAHRGLVHFRGDSSLSSWLHRITLNLARNRYWYYFRRRQHLSVSLDTPLNGDSRATFADLLETDAAGPVRTVTTREFLGHIAAGMARLTAPAREILVLRNTLNHSYAEIAGELGINVGTVKSRVARARANLRQLLAKGCPEFSPAAAPLTWFDRIHSTGALQVISA